MNRKKYIFEVYDTCCQQIFISISDVDLGWLQVGLDLI